MDGTRKIFLIILLSVSFIFTNINYYLFCYCYQTLNYVGEGIPNIKHMNLDNYYIFLIGFIFFSSITTITLCSLFKNLRKAKSNVLIHLMITLLLNYSIIIIIPIFSFFYDDWNKLMFSIWNDQLYIINLVLTFSVTLIIDITNIRKKVITDL